MLGINVFQLGERVGMCTTLIKHWSECTWPSDLNSRLWFYLWAQVARLCEGGEHADHLFLG